MVTKVVTEHDVDNVTIIINPQNKLEAKIPTTSNKVVIEEVPNVVPYNSVVTLNGTDRKITKLGKVSGTEWLVFQLDSPPPPKPRIQKNIRIEFYDDVGADRNPGGATSGLDFNHTGKIRVITEDGSPFTPNGDPAYENYSDFRIEAEVSGNTQTRTNTATINFNTMTYEVFMVYGDPQTSSVLTNATSNGANFTVEHEDAFYNYNITSVSVVENTPSQTEPSNIDTYLEVDCGELNDGGDRYVLPAPLSAKVTTSDTGGKIPKTVKFDVKIGSQTRTYSYPYSASNTYEWNSINDFTYEGATRYSIDNARVEFTDGSVSRPSPTIGHSCSIMGRD